MDMSKAKEERMLQLNELEEIQAHAYESSRIYKERSKRYHDKGLLHKNLHPGKNVLLYNSRLKLFPGKLRSRWSGPFEIIQVFPYGTVELFNPRTKENFKVNGHQVKPYLDGGPRKELVEAFDLSTF